MPTDIAAFPREIRALVSLPCEARVWHALRTNPERSMRGLAADTGIVKSQIAKSIARLVEIGLVEYERGTGKRTNRYRVRGELTEVAMP